MLMAIAMMHAKQSHSQQSPSEAGEASEKECIAVVPLAIPLMTGSGAISMVIIYAHQADNWNERFILTASVIVVSLCV